ncbi:hypothetical protein IMCC9480_3680 [Oxalobacteraceae bacterium IMCC9480]|nr:hypothetical protein IMCC9480_3680 [Oxalobacteraceae bacterium IMCC9480]
MAQMEKNALVDRHRCLRDQQISIVLLALWPMAGQRKRYRQRLLANCWLFGHRAAKYIFQSHLIRRASERPAARNLRIGLEEGGAGKSCA